jgi:tripartite-type tricarboxylate transporter receptor subunit TctC
MHRKLMIPLLLAMASSLAAAQEAYPSRAVKVIVPWPAGGSNDLAARVVMKAVSESTRQPFVIDNRAGAGGTIGADAVAKAAPDGYTIMVHSGTHVANAFLYKTLPYQTLTDFTPVGTIAAQVLGLAVNQNSKARNLKELLNNAKAQPGRVTFATAGVGSGADVQTALLEQIAGVDFQRIPYKGGSPQVQAVIAGETEAGIVALSSISAGVQSGRARLLAVLSPTRSELFPAVPTLAEEGVIGFDFSAWIGAFVPSGTPPAVVSRLSGEIAKALQREDVKKTLSSQGLEPLSLSREDFGRRITADHAKYGKIIESTSKQHNEK